MFLQAKISQKLLKWVWVTVLLPLVTANLKRLSKLGLDQFEKIVARSRERKREAEDKAATARKAASQVAVDPLEAAYQRGRADAYAETAETYAKDREALQAAIENLRAELSEKGQAALETIPDQARPLLAPPSERSKDK